MNAPSREPMTKTVCLNMIVKNEAGIIERCLAAARPAIDRWVIVETGSTDGTQERVRAALQDLPGDLAERPWVDFGHNRTEALRLAEGKADSLLLLDADNLLQIKDPAWRDGLGADAHTLTTRLPTDFQFRLTRLVDARPAGSRRWRYWGATHEYGGAGALPPAAPGARPGSLVRPAGGGHPSARRLPVHRWRHLCLAGPG